MKSSIYSKDKSREALRILIAGGSGLVGNALIPFLTVRGHLVFRLQRDPARSTGNILYWNPGALIIDAEKLEDFDVIIHLGGVNLGSWLWTNKRKKLITDSRVKSTNLLAQTIASLQAPPRVFIVASASGFYGDRGTEILTEDSASGEGFLAGLTREWEKATVAARAARIRVLNVRFGLILSQQGGVLSKLALLSKLGLGAVLGSGRQYWPWISIDDVTGALFHIIQTETINGPVNIVSPNQVTNSEFTAILNRVLRRPTFFSVPSWFLKVALREMGTEMLLASSRVEPKKLIRSGYSFLYPDLEQALRFLCG